MKINEQGCSSKLEDAVKRFSERRVDLSEHERYLKDKVSTMERSIPALMAFNMWKAGEKCKDPPLCKIREIMNKFSPYPDPTETLLENLRTTVQDINREISELHVLRLPNFSIFFNLNLHSNFLFIIYFNSLIYLRFIIFYEKKPNFQKQNRQI